MRHGSVWLALSLALMILWAPFAVAAAPERSTPRVQALGAPRDPLSIAPANDARVAAPVRLDASARTRTNAAGRRLAFPDLDLLSAAKPAPVARTLRPAAEPRTAAFSGTDWLDLDRGNTKTAAAPRTATRDAPWNADRLLADATHMNDAFCALAVSPVTGHLYAVFEAADLGGTDRDIHIARSQDDGQTWTVWEMPSFSEDEYMPDVAIDAAGFIHVVWIRDDGYIVRTRSADGDDPTSWAWIKGLFTDSINATPTVAVTGAGDFATLFIAASYQEINWDLYQWEWTLIWMWSTNAGNTVSFDYLVPDGYPDLWPDAALDGALAHLINGEASVYGDPTRILLATDAVSGGFVDFIDLCTWTTNSCGFPRVAAAAGEVFAVFQHDFDDGLGNIDGDIIYAFSWDSGTTMFGPYEIVADEYESVGPTVFTRDGIVGCLWLDAPPNGDEFDVAARQAGGHGHPDNFGDIEIVTDQNLAEPQYRYLDGAVGDDLLHAGWIDRRDTPTQGHNVYTCERSTHPDLSPFVPEGWDASLVGNMFAGERSTGYLAAGQRAFISFAFINDGLVDTSVEFRIELSVDGTPVSAWTMPGGLAVSTYVTVEDHQLILGAGPHEISFSVDTLGEVPESDETDNVVAETWVWVEGDPLLRVEPAHVTHHFAEPPSRAGLDRLATAPPTRRVNHLEVVDARLRTALTAAAPDGTLAVIVEPVLRLDVRTLDAALGGVSRDQRRETATAALRATLARAGDELAPAFAELSAKGQLADVRELWLAGAYAADLTPAGVQALAADPAVGRIWLDDRKSRTYAAPGSTQDGAEKALAWHLPQVGAPQAWAQGYDGTGVLVGHVDTGVSYDHPDLAGRMWDGGATWPHHGYDAVDDDDDPYEGDTTILHGTHTAGLIVGDGSGGTETGAAPGATLMALRAVPGYYSDMVEAMQFGIDNGPVDLFSFSAGWDDPANELKEANRANADVLLTLGITWITAAGNGDNYGGHLPLPQDIGTPADCPDPWFGAAGHSSVIAVGATDASDAVWANSSIGPTVWAVTGTDYDDYPYPPGLMKPDLSAPGVDVTSTYGNSGYVAYSGTSMSCPLVAGAAAILLQASPGAAPALLAEALESSAVDLGAPGRDNSAGAGRLDIPAALAAIPTQGLETFTLHNDGVLPLSLDAVTWQESWLDVTPLSARIDPGDSLLCRATFDPAGLPAGHHYDDIVLASDDPAGPHTVRAKLIIGDVTDVDGPPGAAIATRLDGYPNPFNPRTTLRFDLARAGRVELAVYDLQGRRVRVLVSAALAAGRHEIVWDGLDGQGRTLSSGVYFARATLPDGVNAVRKMMLVR